MRKRKIVICFFTILLASLFSFGCEPRDETVMKFVGKGEYWEIELLVQRDSDMIVANYLGDFTGLEHIGAIEYRYDWPQEGTEFVDDKKTDSVIYRGEDSERVGTVWGSGGTLLKDVEEEVFSNEVILVPSDKSNLADLIRFTIKWDEQEDIFDIEKVE